MFKWTSRPCQCPIRPGYLCCSWWCCPDNTPVVVVAQRRAGVLASRSPKSIWAMEFSRGMLFSAWEAGFIRLRKTALLENIPEAPKAQGTRGGLGLRRKSGPGRAVGGFGGPCSAPNPRSQLRRHHNTTENPKQKIEFQNEMEINGPHSCWRWCRGSD